MFGLPEPMFDSVRGDSTSHSTVLVCQCGARVVASTRDAAHAEMDAHRSSSGCGRRHR